MTEKTQLLIKPGNELSPDELEQVNDAIQKEFKVTPLFSKDLTDRLFFLVKQNHKLLSMGAIEKVYPVIFNDETFTIHAFLNVIANVKGKGHGKRVVTAMREYLEKKDHTAFGFTMPKNIEFYRKCGLDIDTVSTPRFVYMKDGKRITNQDGQYIFYKDSSDKFMERVQSDEGIDVYIPSDKLW